MRTLISIIFLFISAISFGQKAGEVKVYVNVDDSLVNRYKDSLLLDKTNEVIVFQTKRQFDYLKSGDSILTFIIWRQDKTCLTVIVSDRKVYSAISFAGQNIFNYIDKKITYVTQDEKVLKFTPPIIGNVVYFFSKTTNNYFELTGTNSQPWTYVAKSKKKETARKRYFDLIYSTLKKEKFNFKILNNYKRQL
ncbi:hypothetical protein ACQ33O_08820 [Ferruginibacter sp. SUN002]|uniref:hypothetical protein n=1 Tax=Ferruginibacter sp. SUN002 TaxID=2937789 RepID=UPI003D36E962